MCNKNFFNCQSLVCLNNISHHFIFQLFHKKIHSETEDFKTDDIFSKPGDWLFGFTPKSEENIVFAAVQKYFVDLEVNGLGKHSRHVV